ncbi:MAG: hypothetical protein WBW61_12900 [Rhodanobacteraceae bacterium]
MSSSSRRIGASDTAIRALGSICPTSAAELRAQVVDAFDRHDTNALAELILWDGVGATDAQQRMRELTALIDEPSVRVDFEPDAAGLPRFGDDPAGEMLDFGSGDANPADLRLQVTSIGGCHWLSW